MYTSYQILRKAVEVGENKSLLEAEPLRFTFLKLKSRNERLGVSFRFIFMPSNLSGDHRQQVLYHATALSQKKQSYLETGLFLSPPLTTTLQ